MTPLLVTGAERSAAAATVRGAGELPGGLEVRPIPPAGNQSPVARPAAFTVDVEDWYQSCVDFDAPITERVVRNTDRILEILDTHGVKGTFFVQGLVAEAHPHLVASLVREGHEIQSHGHTHRPLYAMSRGELGRELERAKKTLEDAGGVCVTAFRAPDFSILESNLWALEVLARVGFEVDSSLFPARSSRYGLPGWELGPHRVAFADDTEILEVPVSIWPAGRLRVPVAGGGYFRHLPARVIERGIERVRHAGRPAILYCHPYEFNPRELDDYRGIVPRRLRLSQSFGREAAVERITRLLTRLPFGRFDETLRAYGLRAPVAAEVATPA